MSFLSPPKEGSSLRELELAARHWGLDVNAYKSETDRLPGFRTPFIAHLDLLDRKHYVLVTSVTSDSVTFLEPNTGETQTAAAKRFLGVWTGYALVPGTPWAVLILPTIVLAELVIIAVLLQAIVKGLRRDRLKETEAST